MINVASWTYIETLCYEKKQNTGPDFILCIYWKVWEFSSIIWFLILGTSFLEMDDIYCDAISTWNSGPHSWENFFPQRWRVCNTQSIRASVLYLLRDFMLWRLKKFVLQRNIFKDVPCSRFTFEIYYPICFFHKVCSYECTDWNYIYEQNSVIILW